MASNHLTLTVAFKLKTELYYCPLCDLGAHVHAVASIVNGPKVFDGWFGPENAPTAPDCIAWCREHGEPVDPMPEEIRYGDSDAWRSSDAPSEDCCTHDDCGEDFECDICLRCMEHCGC